jgi:hypothetical protein
MAMPQRTYTPDEVDAILRRALELRGGHDPNNLTHDELVDTARELNIDMAALETAVRAHETDYEFEEARERWKRRRKQKFFEHLRTYLITNAMLLVIDLIFSGGTWFYWALFGWGIGLAFDAAEAFYPKEKDIDKGARRLLRREQKERRKDERRETWHSVANHISQAFLSGGNRPRPRYGAREKRVNVD